MSQRIPRRHILQKSILALAGLSMAGDSLAADRSWSNLSGGTFTTVANWQNGLFAGVNDAACFSNSSVFSPPGLATYTVNFSASAQNQAVKVRNDFVTFNLLGRTYTTTQITGNAIGTVASGGTILVANSARLTIQNGTFNATGALTPQILVGAVPGGNGSLTIGNAGVLAGAPNLFVGTASAFGTLTINGGTATTSTLSFGSGASGRGSGVMNGPFATMTSSRLFVGDAGAGTLSMTIAALLQNNGTAIIGNAAGSTGVVSLDTTSRWTQNGTLIVGGSGAGTINLLNGGSFLGQVGVLGVSSTGVGRLNVDGGSSKASFGNITIGDSGAASVTVSNGGNLARLLGTFTQIVGNNGSGFVDISSSSSWQTGGTTTLASGTNSIGRVDVRGVGSVWGPGTLTIGGRGSGTVNVSDDGGFSSTSATLGFETGANGFVSVDGVGSVWGNSGTLIVGRNGVGALRVTNGARMNNGGNLDARGRGSSVFVAGQDSLLLTDELTVSGGFGLEGRLTIEAGGVVQSSGAGVPDPVGGGLASATVSGSNSRWSITGFMHVGHNFFGPSSAPGSLTINSGALVEANSLRVGNNGTIVINGGTLRLASLQFEETANFVFSSGQVRITGNPTLTESFLDTLLGPTHELTAGRHLSIGGTPTLTAPLVLDGGALTIPNLTVSGAGRLDLTDSALVVDYNGMSPIANIRALLTTGFAAGSWNGNGISSSVAASQSNRALGFAEATDLFSSFPTIFAGETVDSTAVLVRFTLPGDSNLDQIVNISDFAIVAANFNGPSSWSRGDFNYDAVTNITDFALLAANFNQSLPADLPRQSIPEPAGVAGATFVTFLLRNRRRAR